MEDNTPAPEKNETPVAPAPAPAPEPAPVPETPAPAPAEPKKDRCRTGFFDKVALAPFYLFALLLGWALASWIFAGDGFACPSWLRCLSLWAFFLGAVWTVAFRDRVARPAGYVAGFVVLFLFTAVFMPHGSLEERVARKALDAMVADWRAEGYDVSVESLAMEEGEDGAYLGTAMLRSGRQTFQVDLTAAGAETADGYSIRVEGLKAEENPRLAAIRELADRLPPPPAPVPPEDEPAPGAPAK